MSQNNDSNSSSNAQSSSPLLITKDYRDFLAAPASPTSSLNTLDEPISETIKRDANNVWNKVILVLGIKRDTTETSLNEWDFWGPLIFCLLLATALSLREDQSVYLFTLVFLFVWGGASVVYANAQLLGVPLSFMQTVCRLGYALSPLAAIALLSTLLLNYIPVLGTLVTAGAGSWSFTAGSKMIWEGQEQHTEKKYLALYPVLLYYLSLTFLCILS